MVMFVAGFLLAKSQNGSFVHELLKCAVFYWMHSQPSLSHLRPFLFLARVFSQVPPPPKRHRVWWKFMSCEPWSQTFAPCPMANSSICDSNFQRNKLQLCYWNKQKLCHSVWCTCLSWCPSNLHFNQFSADIQFVFGCCHVHTKVRIQNGQQQHFSNFVLPNCVWLQRNCAEDVSWSLPELVDHCAQLCSHDHTAVEWSSPSNMMQISCANNRCCG